MDENRIRKYIQNNIISNIDNYNPRQLTCFHKPWAILYGSINKNYFDIYLMIAIFYENFGYKNYFKWFDFSGNLNENYYKFAKKVLEPRFGVEVSKEYYKVYDEFICKVTTSLINNECVLVPGDLFHIPYYEDYKIKNHIHFFIIKGFDLKKKIFYILDNMHIDNGSDGKYRNFMITFERLFKCAATCRESYFSNEEMPYFWRMKYKGEKEYTIENALSDHKKELSFPELISFPENELWNNKEIGDVGFARNYAKIINYREVYYDTVFKLLRRICNDEGVVNKMIELHDANYLKWESLRTKVLYYYKKKKAADDLKSMYRSCRDENLLLFNEIFNKIDESKNNTINKKDKTNYFYKVKIYNPNAAKIKAEDGIVIVHDQTKVYDTWKNQNNATQLLFNIKDSDKVEFEINLKITNNIDFPFFSGIIASTKDDKILLFGNDALCSMALYCPQYEENFTIEKAEYFSDYMKIKVIVIDNKAIFSYYDSDMDKWIIWESPDELEVNQLGLISKTWNAIEHKSEFSNIKVRINNEQISIFEYDKIEKE